MQAVPATLYDRMGGSDAVAALAVETVRRGLADWRIKRFLEGAQDAAAQAQTAQWLGSALGGPLTYRGPDPSALYSRLAAEKGLNGTHLDTLAQHVAGAMAEMGLSADMIDGLLAALAVHRQGWT
ncbi:hypothetical protein CHLNCDRAFT_138205 [Chlorella variabilis]|uniref:Uncharacterized protein n=1 Tax=Chlorella variabilis TaxID=554065 RepID=E1Z3T2_CHLVA|nr:hypothetical protein CHLNCDRAFT_138205 [Chlorella variabilis]EFN59229.1 hypothetical protein CHLNCDRAFT_138205 [Chlorella variabilis]|eukprot:XP_005851331.1 hypothetical protein CHLNCDRAFT_138205 [Chlorella variabilis]